MRSKFRPDMAGAARSAMRGIGQARQRTRYAAKIDPKGGQTKPVDVVPPAASHLATNSVWPSHDAPLSDGRH